MTIRKLSVAVLLFLSVPIFCAPIFASTSDPVLISDSASTRAIANDAVTGAKEPFAPTSTSFADGRNRVMLYASNLTSAVAEGVSAITAVSEDGNHQVYPLNVEYVGPLPNQPTVTYVVVKLNEGIGNVGDLLVSVTWHGVTSNRVRIGVGQVGGGLADTWFVSPTGSSSGSGSASNPLNLTTAINNPRAMPGSIVWLRGGLYRGAFQSTLKGSDGAPILVRQYPGERAIIDGNGFMNNRMRNEFTAS